MSESAPAPVTVVTPAEVPPLSAEALVDAGIHLGHSTRFWDPRMKRMIFSKRNGIHIINIKETLRGAVRARYFLKNIASAGLDVLLVGTKKQAEEVIRTEATRIGAPFVATRWLGGTLTNYTTIRNRLKRLNEIEELKNSGKFEKLKKKEQSTIEREHRKIAHNLEGLRHLDRLPSAIVVVDARHERNAVLEARKLNIPVVALVDTDSNPETVDICVPANDDSLRGIQILLRYICDGIAEGMEAHHRGAGIKDDGLVVSGYDTMGPSRREQRRDRPAGGGRGGDRRGGGGGRTRMESRDAGTDAAVAEAAEESVAVAEAQNTRARAAVKIKGGPKADAGAAGPAADKAAE